MIVLPCESEVCISFGQSALHTRWRTIDARVEFEELINGFILQTFVVVEVLLLTI